MTTLYIQSNGRDYSIELGTSEDDFQDNLTTAGIDDYIACTGSDELVDECISGHSFDSDKYYEISDYIYKNGTEIDEVLDYIGIFNNWDTGNFEDRRTGSMNFNDYAYDLIQDCYTIPDELSAYIDYDKWTRDMAYDYSEGERGYWFRNC